MKKLYFAIITLSCCCTVSAYAQSNPKVVYEYGRKKSLQIVTYYTYNDSGCVLDCQKFKMISDQKIPIYVEKNLYDDDGHAVWQLIRERNLDHLEYEISQSIRDHASELRFADNDDLCFNQYKALEPYDDLWQSVEYFFYDNFDGDTSCQKTVMIEKNDSTVFKNSMRCELLSSSTYDRNSGQLLEKTIVDYSSDSLTTKETTVSYLDNPHTESSIYHVYDTAYNETYYEDDSVKQITRFRYKKGELVRVKWKVYEKQDNEKWKRTSANTICLKKGYEYYQHGVSLSEHIWSAFSIRTRYTDDMLESKVIGVGAWACIIPMPYRQYFEYEY